MTLSVAPDADPQTAPALSLELWLWPLDGATETEHARLRAHLDLQETARAARFVTPALRTRFEVGRGHLREVLAGFLGCAPCDVPLLTGPHGKPRLAEAAAGPDERSTPSAWTQPASESGTGVRTGTGSGRVGPAFNLAHAGGWAALVTGPHGVALGIDIEPHRDVDPAIAELYFSSAERAELAGLPDAQWQAGFFNAWTRKEALLKALGAGLTRPLDSFDVTLTPGVPARLNRLSGADAGRWQLLPFALRPTFPGCIAVRHAGPVQVSLREGRLPLDDA